MSFRKVSRPFFVLATIVTTILLPNITAFAVSTCSTLYCSSQYSFGSGGDPNLTSGSYKARAQTGDLGVGQTNSTLYTADPGSVTPQEEYLEMVITSASVALGNLLTSTTGTGTASFYIRDYTSSGYIVSTITGTPKYASHSLNAMTSGGVSVTNTEQFGINLVANTSPTTFGAIPAAQPAGYAYGAATAGYNSPDHYKYNAGDTIATSPKGIGQTNFTISYIANISSITPAGNYSVNQILVVTSTY
jgi:hypothetical protein